MRLLMALSVALCVLLVRSSAQDASKKTPHIPLERQLASLVIEKVEFRDAHLAGAFAYLKRKAAEQSGGVTNVNWVMKVPDDWVPPCALTLNLDRIPFLEALRYLGELAAVDYSIEPYAIVVKARVAADAKGLAIIAEEPGAAGEPLVPTTGLAGPLAKPAESVTAGGRNAYRSTGGAIQESKSGYQKHRSTGGWPIAIDPSNKVNVNCTEQGASCRVRIHSPLCLSRGAVNRDQPPSAVVNSSP